MMTTIGERLIAIRERMARAAERSGRDPRAVALVAVSKRVVAARLQEAVAAGQLLFGENYLQEAADKIAALPGVGWHFIGGIQSNKAKQIAELFAVVETVDRLSVGQALEKHLSTLGKTLPVYLQVNIGREVQKSGVLPERLGELIVGMGECPHLQVTGLMAMPPYHPDPEASRGYFRQMKALADELLQAGKVPQPFGLSMGMSADFEVAIEEGATLVRVGTALFGDRG